MSPSLSSPVPLKERRRDSRRLSQQVAEETWTGEVSLTSVCLVSISHPALTWGCPLGTAVSLPARLLPSFSRDGVDQQEEERKEAHVLPGRSDIVVKCRWIKSILQTGANVRPTSGRRTRIWYNLGKGTQPGEVGRHAGWPSTNE